eukprot:gene10300-biopygen16780
MVRPSFQRACRDAISRRFFAPELVHPVIAHLAPQGGQYRPAPLDTARPAPTKPKVALPSSSNSNNSNSTRAGATGTACKGGVRASVGRRRAGWWRRGGVHLLHFLSRVGARYQGMLAFAPRSEPLRTHTPGAQMIRMGSGSSQAFQRHYRGGDVMGCKHP